MERIRKHFEEEAKEYDGIIKNLIPYYNQMVVALVNAIPFSNQDEIDVIDLGCGTGSISKAVQSSFPRASMTCVDISANMLDIAACKMSDFNNTKYINSNFYGFNFDRKYDAVVSSLALHHLETKEDKFEFYRKIFDALKPEGVFVNADVVLASSDKLQDCYMKEWKRFMCKNVSESEVDSKWMPSYYAEDRPISLMEHFELLKEAGFENIDVVWKYYNFAVYMAVKKL